MQVKMLLDQITTRTGMFSNISNYFISSEMFVIEHINGLNALLTELVASVNFRELLESFNFKTYKSWKEGMEVNPNMLPVYSLTNNIDGFRFVTITTGTSTIDPITLNLKKNETGTTSDGITWINKGDWCEYPMKDIVPDYCSLSANTLVDFDRTTPMTGISDEEWQRARMLRTKSHTGFYMMRGDRMFLFPGYNDETTISGFYYSNLPVIDEFGIRKATVSNNTDEVLLPPLLLQVGTAYKWLKDKNLENWSELNSMYDELISQYQALSKSSKTIRLNGIPSGWSPLPDSFSSSNIVTFG